jgi:phage shock protein E
MTEPCPHRYETSLKLESNHHGTISAAGLSSLVGGPKVWFAAALAIAALAGCSASGKPEGFQLVGVTEGARLAQQPGTLILDVRTPQEYVAGHIKGAVLLPVGDLSSRLGDLPKDRKTPLLVYCAAGPRSLAASRFLAERGYSAVSELKGGITAWQSEGKPVVR